MKLASVLADSQAKFNGKGSGWLEISIEKKKEGGWSAAL
jgi:hypothetical protein